MIEYPSAPTQVDLEARHAAIKRRAKLYEKLALVIIGGGLFAFLVLMVVSFVVASGTGPPAVWMLLFLVAPAGILLKKKSLLESEYFAIGRTLDELRKKEGD